jgi:hypothetical protein
MIGGLWGKRCGKTTTRAVRHSNGFLSPMLACEDCVPEQVRLGWTEIPEEELVALDVMSS